MSPQTIECVIFINNYFLKYLFAYNQVSVFINGCLRELPLRSGTVVERGYRYIKFLENVYGGFLFSLRHTLAKNQAKTKQHAETEFLLFENYSLFSSLLLSKINGRYLNPVQKQVRLFK